MGRVVSVEPIFVVSDVARAVAHYEQLGFSASHHDEGYAFAHRNELTIHLAGPGLFPERVGRGTIYMHVDDADALAEEWRGAGIDFVAPQDFEWGKLRARMKIPTGTSFASGHHFVVSAVDRPFPGGTDPANARRASSFAPSPLGCSGGSPSAIPIPTMM